MYLLVTMKMTETCQPSCPVAKTARIIEGKWTTLVIRDLLSGSKRFSQLVRGLDGVSPKVLTERLKMLEEQGLITKTIHPCIPPKTEYALTPLGFQLMGVIQAMAEFGGKLA